MTKNKLPILPVILLIFKYKNMFKNLKDWKTTITGLVMVILQALPIVGFEIPEDITGVIAWFGGLLLLISGDPDTTAKLKTLNKSK